MVGRVRVLGGWWRRVSGELGNLWGKRGCAMQCSHRSALTKRGEQQKRAQRWIQRARDRVRREQQRGRGGREQDGPEAERESTIQSALSTATERFRPR